MALPKMHGVSILFPRDGIPNGLYIQPHVPWLKRTSPKKVFSNNRAADTSKIITIRNKFHPFSSESYTSEDAYLFKKICIAVSTRSASLVAASTIALLQVNNELSKSPMSNERAWCSSNSSGTPSPSDSGLGSLDEEIRWSRRGSIFSVQGSRRGSLASPTLLSFPPKAAQTDDQFQDSRVTTIIQENGIVMEEPSEMHLEEVNDDNDDDVVVVAFCGSVMEKYHSFRSRCQSILDQLVQHP